MKILYCNVIKKFKVMTDCKYFNMNYSRTDQFLYTSGKNKVTRPHNGNETKEIPIIVYI